MRPIAGVIVSCLCLMAGDAALAAAVPAAGSRIVEVTVFPDRAEAVREARVDLPAGASTVEFPDLPFLVEPDSLRVTARGVPAALGAVELRQRADEPKESPEMIAARDEVRRLEGALAALDVEAETDKELREFISALRASTAQRESERMGEGRADPASLQAVYALVRSGMQDLGKEKLARADRRAKLVKDLEVARARLAAARPAGAIRSRVATVEVVAERAGALTLRLSYLAPGASWRPAYRASLDAGTGEVSLASEAVVRQNTGEDWSGVVLKLSTAAPARGVNPPVLTSWLLRPVEVMMTSGVAGGFADQIGQKEVAKLKSMGYVAAEAAADEAKDVEAERRDAGLVHSSYNVAFEVPGRSDVAADGSDHRVGLRQESLPGRVEYRSVPGLNAAAYLIAKTTAPADYPLLSGPVRVFAGGAFLGIFPLQETAPKADLKLPFGVDNRVRVERTPLPQARTQEGFIGKDKRIAYAFRTTIENLRDQKVTVAVEDRFPVSEDERITVEKGKGTTPGAQEVKDRPGVVEWILELEPKQKREIVLEYAIRFPRELSVPGTD